MINKSLSDCCSYYNCLTFQMHADEFDYYWRIENFLLFCVQFPQRPPIQSDSFFFGPGNWRLSHDPKQSSEYLYFTLGYLGNHTDKEKKDDSTGTFSFVAKLALISSDGSKYGERSKSIIDNKHMDVRKR